MRTTDEACPSPDLDVVCERFRAILEQEPGNMLLFEAFTKKYTELFGPFDTACLGFSTLAGLLLHAGLRKGKHMGLSTVFLNEEAQAEALGTNKVF